MSQPILFVDIFASDLVYAFPYFWNLLGKSMRLTISHNVENTSFLKCQLIINERTDHLVQIEKSIASCGYADIYGMTNGNDCWRLTPQSISIKSAPAVDTPVETLATPTLATPTLATPTLATLTFVPPTFAPPTFVPPTFASPTFASPTFASPTFAPPTFAPPTFAPPTFAKPTFVWGSTSTSTAKVAEVKFEVQKEKEPAKVSNPWFPNEKAKEPQFWKQGDPWIKEDKEEDRGSSLYW